MAPKPKPSAADFRAFDAAVNRAQRDNREARFDAVGLLTPQLLRKHLKNRQNLVLAFGRRGLTVKYSFAELKKFAAALDKAAGKYEHVKQGVPVPQLIASSDRARIHRANIEIRSAVPYRFSGNTVRFRVSSSGKRPDSPSAYRVEIRLDEWTDLISRPIQYLTAARRAVQGRVSVSCTCPDWQFVYRYLATIGKFNIAPLEKDFPKIKNPRLKGACCKHVLKALQKLQTPAIYKLIKDEMESQASRAGGYADDKVTRYFRAEEVRKAGAAVRKPIDPTEAKRAWDKLVKTSKQAGEAFRRKQAGRAGEKEKEARRRMAEVEKLKAIAAKERSDRQKALRKNFLKFRDAMASAFNREQIIKAFAAAHGMTEKAVRDVAKEAES